MKRVTVVLIASALLIPVMAVAGGGRDHDAVKRLREAGDILPLEAIVDLHRRRHGGGRLLESELELERGRYVYELKILGRDGTVREFEYDARSGELLKIETKRRKPRCACC